LPSGCLDDEDDVGMVVDVKVEVGPVVWLGLGDHSRLPDFAVGELLDLALQVLLVRSIVTEDFSLEDVQ
jgi:hypothetical protein